MRGPRATWPPARKSSKKGGLFAIRGGQRPMATWPARSPRNGRCRKPWVHTRLTLPTIPIVPKVPARRDCAAIFAIPILAAPSAYNVSWRSPTDSTAFEDFPMLRTCLLVIFLWFSIGTTFAQEPRKMPPAEGCRRRRRAPSTRRHHHRRTAAPARHARSLAILRRQPLRPFCAARDRDAGGDVFLPQWGAVSVGAELSGAGDAGGGGLMPDPWERSTLSQGLCI